MIEGSDSEWTGGLKICHCSSRWAAKGLSCSSEAGWNKSRPQKPFDLLQPGSRLKWHENERGMSFCFVNSRCCCRAKDLRSDMTGDCFKCPQRWNGWTCSSVAAKTLLAVWVQSCGYLAKTELSWGEYRLTQQRPLMCPFACAKGKSDTWVCVLSALSSQFLHCLYI